MRIRLSTKLVEGRSRAVVDFDRKGVLVRIGVGKADLERAANTLLKRVGGAE